MSGGRDIRRTGDGGSAASVIRKKKQSRYDALFVVFDGATFGKSKVSLTEFVLRDT